MARSGHGPRPWTIATRKLRTSHHANQLANQSEDLELRRGGLRSHAHLAHLLELQSAARPAIWSANNKIVGARFRQLADSPASTPHRAARLWRLRTPIRRRRTSSARRRTPAGHLWSPTPFCRRASKASTRPSTQRRSRLRLLRHARFPTPHSSAGAMSRSTLSADPALTTGICPCLINLSDGRTFPRTASHGRVQRLEPHSVHHGEHVGYVQRRGRTDNGTFGQYTAAGNPRQLQLALRISF